MNVPFVVERLWKTISQYVACYLINWKSKSAWHSIKCVGNLEESLFLNNMIAFLGIKFVNGKDIAKIGLYNVLSKLQI